MVRAGLDVRPELDRGRVTGAAVGYKRAAVVRHGSSKCGRAVREVAAAAYDACRMTDRHTNPAVDVFPLDRLRPSHVALANRKSICPGQEHVRASRL